MDAKTAGDIKNIIRVIEEKDAEITILKADLEKDERIIVDKIYNATVMAKELDAMITDQKAEITSLKHELASWDETVKRTNARDTVLKAEIDRLTQMWIEISNSKPLFSHDIAEKARRFDEIVGNVCTCGHHEDHHPRTESWPRTKDARVSYPCFKKECPCRDFKRVELLLVATSLSAPCPEHIAKCRYCEFHTSDQDYINHLVKCPLCDGAIVIEIAPKNEEK